MGAPGAVAAIVELVLNDRWEMWLSSRVGRWKAFRLGFTRYLPIWVKMR